MSTSRLDDFVGSDGDYIRYLERLVKTFRTQRNEQSAHVDSDVTASAYEVYGSFRRIPSDVHDIGNETQFFQYVPEPLGYKTGRTGNPPWLQNAKALVKDTPGAKDWNRTLEEKGLHEVIASGKALTYLLDTGVQTDISLVSERIPQVATSDVLGYVRNYAQATASRTLTASVALVLVNFQRFLVLSACAVLLKEGFSSGVVYDIVKICMGNCVSDEYCDRLLSSAKFVNELIDLLYSRGWGFRAGVLLLLCKSILHLFGDYLC